jgi:hypothetical protein
MEDLQPECACNGPGATDDFSETPRKIKLSPSPAEKIAILQVNRA